jgi:hypothetical protein
METTLKMKLFTFDLFLMFQPSVAWWPGDPQLAPSSSRCHKGVVVRIRVYVLEQPQEFFVLRLPARRKVLLYATVSIAIFGPMKTE